MRESRGFTLVEILVALVIMGLVTGSLYQLLVNTQRLSRAQTEQVDLQSNVRTGSLVVPNELRELSTVLGGTFDQNDILQADPDLIQYRAMRGLYMVCQVTTALEVRVLKNGQGSFRTPQAGDGLYVFIEGPDQYSEKDDSWLHVPAITGAPDAACPGGDPGLSLTIPNIPGVAGLEVNTPVRVYEIMELSLYVNDGRSWLGARSISGGGVVQPILGPLVDADGFALEYLDATGNPAGALNAITSIRATVIGLTDEAVRVNGAGAWGRPQDTLVTQVLLRNSVRP